jgi:hypothetical protein
VVLTFGAVMDVKRVFICFGSRASIQNSLNLKLTKLGVEAENLSQDNVLVAITVSREKGEIVYRVESSNDLSEEELEYYIGEIINGLCKWKKDICEESVRSFKGKIKEKKK